MRNPVSSSDERKDTGTGGTHLRILRVRVLRDAEDGNRHLDEEVLQGRGVQEADDGREPAQNRGGLARPLALQEKRLSVRAVSCLQQKERTAAVSCMLGRSMCAWRA